MEYSIYGIVLNSVDREYRKNNKGKTQHYLILTKLFSSKGVIPDAENRSLVPNKLPFRRQYSLVDETEIDGLIEKGLTDYEKEKKLKPMNVDMCGESIWKYLYSRYPDSSGYYHFSNIVFDRAKRRAHVTVKGIGGYWNSSVDHSLIKTRKGWKITSSGGGFGVC